MRFLASIVSCSITVVTRDSIGCPRKKLPSKVNFLPFYKFLKNESFCIGKRKDRLKSWWVTCQIWSIRLYSNELKLHFLKLLNNVKGFNKNLYSSESRLPTFNNYKEILKIYAYNSYDLEKIRTFLDVSRPKECSKVLGVLIFGKKIS